MEDSYGYWICNLETVLVLLLLHLKGIFINKRSKGDRCASCKKKRKMKVWIKRILILSIICSSLSCEKNEKFKSEKWKQGGGENLLTEMRWNMTNDLINSKILVGKNQTEIHELLGNPEPVNTYSESDTKFYPVMEKYEWNVDPDELIYLEIRFNKVGLAENIEVYKTK